MKEGVIMADVRFCQQQELFKSEPFDRWARLIVYEDEYSDCIDSASPFSFQLTCESYRRFSGNRFIGEKKIPVGISEWDEAGTMREHYDTHQEIIENLLKEDIQKVDVVLYTTSERFKEAFYNDFENTMNFNSKITDEKEILYWSYCGKNNRVLLVAFEDLSSYKEGKEYLDDNLS